MRLPVDTSAMTLVAMAPPEPVVDFATRAPKADANGLPLFTVQVAAMFQDQGEVLAVKVAGEPAGISAGRRCSKPPWLVANRMVKSDNRLRYPGLFTVPRNQAGVPSPAPAAPNGPGLPGPECSPFSLAGPTRMIPLPTGLWGSRFPHGPASNTRSGR